MEEQEKNISIKPEVIFIDVYQTILDMRDIERKVNDLFDNKRGYAMWFEMFMQYCFVDNCTAKFHDFSSIARATLQMAAKSFKQTIDEDDVNYLLQLFIQLPEKEGVQNGLSSLYDQGYRLAALTNSTEAIVKERMSASGLISYFNMLLSAEQIKKYKPCIEVYEWAAKKMEVSVEKALLVSCHGWDISGAINAGMQTAFVEEPREMLYPLAPLPNYQCKNLEDLATQLQALYSTANHEPTVTE